jgi:hypothetical protein
LGAAARFASFMPDLKPGYNLIRLILWTIRGLRHCEELRDEAIQLAIPILDCFAALAMTTIDKEWTDV